MTSAAALVQKARPASRAMCLITTMISVDRKTNISAKHACLLLTIEYAKREKRLALEKNHSRARRLKDENLIEIAENDVADKSFYYELFSSKEISNSMLLADGSKNKRKRVKRREKRTRKRHEKRGRGNKLIYPRH